MILAFEILTLVLHHLLQQVSSLLLCFASTIWEYVES